VRRSYRELPEWLVKLKKRNTAKTEMQMAVITDISLPTY
jgi:hypothetical protein